ncbi:MAG: chemotaxis protein CheW, partial [Methylophilales bacterium 16-45-9]
RSLQEMQIETLDEDSQKYFAKQKLVDDEKNQWLELDTESLVQDKNFIQPI